MYMYMQLCLSGLVALGYQCSGGSEVNNNCMLPLNSCFCKYHMNRVSCLASERERERGREREGERERTRERVCGPWGGGEKPCVTVTIS